MDGRRTGPPRGTREQDPAYRPTRPLTAPGLRKTRRRGWSVLIVGGAFVQHDHCNPTITQPPSRMTSVALRTVQQTVVTTTERTVTAPPKPVPTPATPRAGSVRPLGQAFDFNVVKVTVLETKVPMTIGTHPPDAGNQFAGVLAQTCIPRRSQPTYLTRHPWNLEDADGGRYPAGESAYEDTPQRNIRSTGKRSSSTVIAQGARSRSRSQNRRSPYMFGIPWTTLTSDCCWTCGRSSLDLINAETPRSSEAERGVLRPGVGRGSGSGPEVC